MGGFDIVKWICEELMCRVDVRYVGVIIGPCYGPLLGSGGFLLWAPVLYMLYHGYIRMIDARDTGVRSYTGTYE